MRFKSVQCPQMIPFWIILSARTQSLLPPVHLFALALSWFQHQERLGLKRILTYPTVLEDGDSTLPATTLDLPVR